MPQTKNKKEKQIWGQHFSVPHSTYGQSHAYL